MAMSNETSYAFLGLQRPAWMLAATPCTTATAEKPNRARPGAPPRPSDATPSPPGSSQSQPQPHPPKWATNAPIKPPGSHLSPRRPTVAMTAAADASRDTGADGPPGASTANFAPSQDTRIIAHAQHPLPPSQERQKMPAPHEPSILPSPALTSEPSPAASTPNFTESAAHAEGPAALSHHSLASPAASLNPTPLQSAQACHTSTQTPPTGPNEPSHDSSAHSVPQPEPGGTIHAVVTALAPSTAPPAAASPALILNPPRSASGAKRLSSQSAAPGPVQDEGAMDPRPQKRLRTVATPQTPHTVSPVATDSPQPLVHYLQGFEAQLKAALPTAAGNSPIMMRYTLLLEAFQKNDTFFIILHQIFCLWLLDKNFAYPLINVPRPLSDSALRILSSALNCNADLYMVNTTRWFASWPLPAKIYPGAQIRQMAAKVFQQIDHFIPAFVHKWQPVAQETRNRGFPMLVGEMKEQLMCPSPTMHSIFFSSTRRAIGYTDDQPIALMLQRIFLLDQGNESQPRTDPVALSYLRQGVVHQYSSLVMGSLTGQTQLSHTVSHHTHHTMSEHAPSAYYPGQPQIQLPVLMNNVAASTTVFSNSPHGVNAFGANAGFRPMRGQGHIACPAPAYSTPMANSGNMLTPSLPDGFVASSPAGYVQGGAHAAAYSMPPQTATQSLQGQRLIQTAPPPQVSDTRQSRLTRPMGNQQGAFFAQGQQQLVPLAQRPVQTWPSGPQQPPVARQSSQMGRGQHPVAQPSRNLPPTNEWESVSVGLHLLHLRSPTRAPLGPSSHNDDKRFYQYVTHFAVEPRVMAARPGLRFASFSVSEEEKAKLVMTTKSNGLPMALYSCKSLRYRLRMCKYDRDACEAKTGDWVTRPCAWPTCLFLTFNDQMIQPRRGQHFGRDLPIELSDLVCVGENTLKVSMPDEAANHVKDQLYWMAVEVVTFDDHDGVRLAVEMNEHTTIAETKQDVERRLTAGNSDDVVVQNNSLCVSITDPFSFDMIETPVRGVDCKHLECFDLENWLQTRPQKQSKTGNEPCTVDCWKCPICGLDARPVSLRVNDFLIDVRRNIKDNKSVCVKKIEIVADGSWKAIEEDDDDETEDETPLMNNLGPRRKEASSRTDSTPTVKRALRTVIVLDDDDDDG
ncbi:hypothetical protein CDD82_5300 [Ophiocordyceps australis]|uniref:SP-RING-type domain-containing protein n=1 Tax=Ophiocordyceps australis TaxID=1399860 RepID=A0A2C5Z252_9HYPO|nr:hypothetical protein CDD82_5300 [Ophiocordyceps australis]